MGLKDVKRARMSELDQGWVKQSAPSSSSPKLTEKVSSLRHISAIGDTATGNTIPGQQSDAFSTSAITATTVEEFLRALVEITGTMSQACVYHGHLLYKGLRVRIGLHTGLTDPACLIQNSRTNRVQYVGRPLALANAVCSAGEGGWVLLSGDTFTLVQDSTHSSGVLFASMGQQRLKDVQPAVMLYQAWSRELVYRACAAGQLRYCRQLSPTYLEAPYNQVAVCFMNVVGLGTLNAWSAHIARASVDTYQRIAGAELEKWQGYFVNGNANTGLLVTAFTQPAYAIRWALSTIRACLDTDWDPALLDHELGGK